MSVFEMGVVTMGQQHAKPLSSVYPPDFEHVRAAAGI
jgi:hypothetical protein